MNQKRRQDIKMGIYYLNRSIDIFTQALNDEEIYYDNIPENLQSSLKAMDSEDAISILDDLLQSLEEAQKTIKRLG